MVEDLYEGCRSGCMIENKEVRGKAPHVQPYALWLIRYVTTTDPLRRDGNFIFILFRCQGYAPYY